MVGAVQAWQTAWVARSLRAAQPLPLVQCALALPAVHARQAHSVRLGAPEVIQTHYAPAVVTTVVGVPPEPTALQGTQVPLAQLIFAAAVWAMLRQPWAREAVSGPLERVHLAQ